MYQQTIYFATLRDLYQFIEHADLPGTLTDTTQDTTNGVFLANYWYRSPWGQKEQEEIKRFPGVTKVELNQPIDY